MSLYHGGRKWDINKLNDFKFYFYDISIKNALRFLSEELTCQYFRYLFVLTFSKIYVECISCMTEHICPVSFPWWDLAFLIIFKAQEGSTLLKMSFRENFQPQVLLACRLPCCFRRMDLTLVSTRMESGNVVFHAACMILYLCKLCSWF